MAKEAPAVPDKAPPQRRRRWLRRAAWLLAILALTAGTVWLFRVRILNAVLAKLSPDYPVAVKDVTWTDGGVRLKHVAISQAGVAEPFLEIPEGHVTLSPTEAKTGKLGKIRLKSPILNLTPAFFKHIADAPAASGGASGPGTKLELDGIEIEAASVQVLSPTGQSITGEITWQGGKVDVREDGTVGTARQKVILRNLEARQDGKPVIESASEVEAEFSLDRQNRQLVIHHFKTKNLSAPGLSAVWQALSQDLPNDAAQAAAVAQQLQKGASTPGVIESYRIENCEVGPLHLKFDSVPGLPGLPTIQANVMLSSREVPAPLDGAPASHQLTLRIEEGLVGSAEAPVLRLPLAEAKISGQWPEDVRIDSLTLPEADFALMPELFKDLGVPPGTPIPALEGKLEVQLSGGHYSAKNGFVFPPTQRVALTQFSAKTPHAVQPFAKWSSLQVIGAPNVFLATKELAAVHIDNPQVTLSGADLSFFSPVETNAPASPAESTESPPPQKPFWDGIMVRDLSIKDGRVQTKNLGEGIPDASLNLDVRTGSRLPGGEVRYLADISKIAVENPENPLAPLYSGHRLEIDAHPVRLWTLRQIERLHLLGSRVHVGANAETLVDTAEGEFESKTAGTLYTVDEPSGVPPQDWHVKSATLENTKIYLHGIVPDLAEVVLPVSHKVLHNVPLTAEGLRQSEKMERLELPLIYIPGTRAGAAVADLDTNFLHFSFAGLMRRELPLVEMVNPKIYVGDSLFHYVDKIRIEAEKETKDAAVTAIRAMLVTAFSMLNGETEPPAQAPGWKIKRLRAHNGKLITTVRDSPVISVPPLPFAADSALEDGQVNAELAVPPGIYKPVLGLELEAEIARGQIVFNLPLKDKDNNLVQVFEATWLRWKQLRIADVKLSVTFDENGIYSRFWAKGYDGLLEGAFNLYLDDAMSWDMWLLGTDLNMKKITEALCPHYFIMDGKFSGLLVAQGDKTSLYQATGEFKNLNGGKLKIIALEDVIKNIPEDWQEAQRKIVIKALETLRDFAYTTCKGNMRFYGMEGTLELKIEGPDGKRNFSIHAHDHRLRAED